MEPKFVADASVDASRRPARVHRCDGGLRYFASLGPGGTTARPRGSACPGGLREAFCEASEERQGGRGGHRGSGLAPDHALRGGQERRDPGARGRIPDASMSGPATHAAINALRGHLAEFGLVAPKGPASLKLLENALEDEATDLPRTVREMGTIYLSQIARLTEVIEQLADELEAALKIDAQLRRLCTIPGIGPVTAGAVSAFAPDLDTFDSGRNFAAWLGLVPRQRYTGGKTKLASVSKMGQTDIRRLLIVGAMSVIRWLAALVARKLRMVAAVALANKMARMIWALTTKKEDYRMA